MRCRVGPLFLLGLLAGAILAAGQDMDMGADPAIDEAAQAVEGAAEAAPHMPTHAFVHDMQKKAFERHVRARAAAAAADMSALDPREMLAADTASTSTVAEIRIATSFDATVYALTATNQALVINTVATAVQVLRKFYKVNVPISSSLTVTPAADCPSGCGTSCPTGTPATYTIPAQLKNGSGQPNADLFIVVRAGEQDQCTNTVAWAFSCYFDSSTNRPIAGFVNVCPYFFTDSQFSPPLLTRVATIVHEITHALGFTSDFFFPLSGEYTAASDVYGDTVNYITSTSVTAVTRAFFNCPSVIGAQLEDQGGSGSANSHWDFRLFNGELMTPSGGYLLSNFTLSVMQDLGWYSPRFFFATPFIRGMNSGCNLLTETCANMISSTAGQEFYCSSSGYGSCVDWWNKAECSSSGFVFNKPLTCQVASNYGAASNDDCRSTSTPYAIDYVSSTSMCLATTWRSTSVGACFDATCNNGAYIILAHPIAGGTAVNVSCPTGSSVDLFIQAPTAYSSSTIAVCPNNAAACGTLSCNPKCNTLNGQCLNGVCVCYLEWLGVDCNLHVSAVVGTFDSYSPTMPPSPPPGAAAPPPLQAAPPPPYAVMDPTNPQIQMTVQATLSMNFSALLTTGHTTARLLLSSYTLATFEIDFISAVAGLLKIPISSVNISTDTGTSASAVIVFTVLPNTASGAAANLVIAPLVSSPYTALGSAFVAKYSITGATVVVLSTTTVVLDTSAPSPPSALSTTVKFPLALVIGVTGGFVALLAAVTGTVVWCCCCRGRQRIGQEGKVIEMSSSTMSSTELSPRPLSTAAVTPGFPVMLVATVQPHPMQSYAQPPASPYVQPPPPSAPPYGQQPTIIHQQPTYTQQSPSYNGGGRPGSNAGAQPAYTHQPSYSRHHHSSSGHSPQGAAGHGNAGHEQQYAPPPQYSDQSHPSYDQPQPRTPTVYDIHQHQGPRTPSSYDQQHHPPARAPSYSQQQRTPSYSQQQQQQQSGYGQQQGSYQHQGSLQTFGQRQQKQGSPQSSPHRGSGRERGSIRDTPNGAGRERGSIRDNAPHGARRERGSIRDDGASGRDMASTYHNHSATMQQAPHTADVNFGRQTR